MIKKRLGVLLVVLALLSVSGVIAQDDQQLDVLEYTLDNGLEVILVEDHSAPTVAVDVWYQVGGANDPVERSGFAHLFEHMMFQGSAHNPKGAFDELLNAAGASSNAYTATDITGYYEAIPSYQLPLALWLEADRMASLDVSQVNFDNQRAVVVEELKERVTNSPYGEAFRTLLTIPFEYEPYQRRTIGSIEDLNKATIDDVRNFHNTYYVPNNATLVVAGDIDFETAQGLIERYFAGIPGADEPQELPAYTSEQQPEAEFLTIEDSLINVPAVLVGYEAPPRSDADYPALELLTRILSAGDSSRLAVSLLDTGMAMQASASLSGRRGPSLFYAVLIPNQGIEPADIEQVYYDELDKILTEGVETAELEKVINQIRVERILGLESALGLAESVQEANYYFDDPQAVFTEISRYEEVTAADIQRVLAEYLAPEDRHVINVVQGEATVSAEAEPIVEETGEVTTEYAYVIPDDTPPEPLPITTFNLPTITETTLDNGLEVIVIEQPSVPIISIDLYLPGGDIDDPADKVGLATLTSALLTRGTETRTAQELASTIEQLGGSVGSGSDDDAMSVGIFALSEDAELAYELLGDMVMNSTFPEEELDVERESWFSSIEYILSEPDYLANRMFRHLLYGEHPYGALITAETLKAITRDDVVAFYEAQRQPEGAFLVVTGDIASADAVALAEATFGEWKNTAEREDRTYLELTQPAETTIYLVDRPGSSQVQFIIGNLGDYGNTPDRFAQTVMNDIFGGGFSSRLNKNIREEKGYTYGIGSGFTRPAEDRGSFYISAAVRNEVVDLALQEVLSEIERMRSEEVPAEELTASKDGIINSFALNLETYQAFVNNVASAKLRGIPLSAIADYPENIEAIDQNAVLKAAQESIQPENMVIVAVGDASVIEDKLAEIAPVEIIEAE